MRWEPKYTRDDPDYIHRLELFAWLQRERLDDENLLATAQRVLFRTALYSTKTKMEAADVLSFVPTLEGKARQTFVGRNRISKMMTRWTHRFAPERVEDWRYHKTHPAPSADTSRSKPKDES